MKGGRAARCSSLNHHQGTDSERLIDANIGAKVPQDGHRSRLRHRRHNSVLTTPPARPDLKIRNAESTQVSTIFARPQRPYHFNMNQLKTIATMSSSAIPTAMKQAVKARAKCSFPSMVHQCLFDIEELARRDPKMQNLLQIVSWEKQGKAFRIHDRTGFETLIMPVWFVRLKYNSFLRQLSQFGFKKNYHDSDFARKGGECRCTLAV